MSCTTVPMSISVAIVCIPTWLAEHESQIPCTPAVLLCKPRAPEGCFVDRPRYAGTLSPIAHRALHLLDTLTSATACRRCRPAKALTVHDASISARTGQAHSSPVGVRSWARYRLNENAGGAGTGRRMEFSFLAARGCSIPNVCPRCAIVQNYSVNSRQCINPSGARPKCYRSQTAFGGTEPSPGRESAQLALYPDSLQRKRAILSFCWRGSQTVGRALQMKVFHTFLTGEMGVQLLPFLESKKGDSG